MSDNSPGWGGKVTASILTYNAVKTLPDVIAGLEAQTRPPDRILIVDNASTDGTAEYIKQLPDRYEKVFQTENRGVGAGHNTAWQEILTDPDCEYVWTLENDSIPPNHLLERLVEVATELEKAGVRFGCIMPRQIEPGSDTSIRVEEDPKPVRSMTFNGALIRTAAIATVGLIREDFFMDQEDREYASRMKAAGLPIFRDPNSLIIHMGKGSFRAGPPSVLRTYYRVRNETYTRTSIAREPLGAVKSLARAVGAIGRTFLFEDEKARRIRARWRGTIDGLRGDLGKKDYSFLR